MQRPHPDRRRLLLARDRALLAHFLFGVAGAAREVLDHLTRQPGRQSGPAVGQEIDVQPLAGGHGVHCHLARQRDTDALAVGIAARGTDIARGTRVDAVNIDFDRLPKGDDQNAVGEAHLGLVFVREDEHEPGKAAVDHRAHIGFDRLGNGGARRRERRQQHEKEHSGAPPAASGRPPA